MLEAISEPVVLFQSTLPMRGATVAVRHGGRSGGISIHTPHAGSDVTGTALVVRCSRFQSTLPMRGATAEPSDDSVKDLISIHTPHAGSDASLHLA